MVIGGKNTEGKVKPKLKFRIIRGEEIISQGDIVSLHRNKDEVKEVGEGEEFGLKVHTSKKIEIGDVLEFLEMQEIKE
jgi:translation initiation factor IF-2